MYRGNIAVQEGGAVKVKEYKQCLLHITGYKRQVQVCQVPIKVESLNNSDCFILDGGLKVLQFNGAKSSAWETRKANAITDELQASRHSKVKETHIIDGIDDKGHVLIEEFWGYFGGRLNAIVEEEKLDEPKKIEYTLQHISDACDVMELKVK